jgi:hypothetical protein
MASRDKDESRQHGWARRPVGPEAPGRSAEVDEERTRRLGYDPRYNTSGRRQAQDVRQFGGDRGYGSYGAASTERSHAGHSELGRQGAFNAPDAAQQSRHGGYGTHGSHPGQSGSGETRPRYPRPPGGTYGEMEQYGDPQAGFGYGSERDWSGTRGQGGYGDAEERSAYRGGYRGGYRAVHGDGHRDEQDRGGRSQGDYPQRTQERGSFGGWSSSSSHQQRGPKGYKRSDERLLDEICQRIAQSDIDASDVTVQVQDGHVTLDGTIPHRRMKYELEEMADRVMGVSDIDNRLRMPRSQGIDQERKAQQAQGSPGGGERSWGGPGDEPPAAAPEGR